MGPEFAPPSPNPPPAPPPYLPTPPPRPRRLARSSRERMWAGVAGGLAEYFDLDPNLVRVLWVAGTILSHGIGIPLYILLWVILPRDDRTRLDETRPWRDWSEEFHAETQRLAEEARRVADDVRGAGQSWRAPDPAGPTEPAASYAPASAKGASPAGDAIPHPDETAPWWSASDRYVDRHRGRHPRSTGIALLTLGIVLLAANSGLFNWLDWHVMWPVIFIGLGVILLARQSGWGR
jgi:phage shock protein C